MTPTKDGAQVMMREFFTVLETDLNWDLSTYLPAIKHCYEQALTQPPVDVEALKCDAREAVYHRQKNIAEPDVVQDIVWDCIDYLVSKGYLK